MTQKIGAFGHGTAKSKGVKTVAKKPEPKPDPAAEAARSVAHAMAVKAAREKKHADALASIPKKDPRIC